MANTSTSTITGPTRVTVVSLLVAAVLIFAIAFVRDEEVGFSLVVGAVVLLAAVAAWRFGLAGHIVAGVVGLLLLLLFGFYTVSDVTGVDEAGVEYDENVALVIDVLVAAAGAIAVYGAASFVRRSRRSGHRPSRV